MYFWGVAPVDATKGNYGEQVVHPIQFPLFVDCKSSPTQVIEVTILDDVSNIEGLQNIYLLFNKKHK